MYRRWDKSKPPLGPFTLNRESPLAYGLVAWYPFGVAGGNFVADQSGGSFHMTAIAAPKMSLGADGEPIFNFVAASVQYLVVSSVVSALPFTFGCWGRVDTASTAYVLMCIANTGGVNPLFQLTATTGNVYAAQQRDGAAVLGTATGTVTHAVGEWQHVAAVFASGSSRSIYTKGGDKVTETTACGGTTVNNTTLGIRNTATAPLNGGLSQPGIWNRALTDSEVARSADHGLKYELWYPLRSRKWFASGAAATFKPYWASQHSRVIGAGVH